MRSRPLLFVFAGAFLGSLLFLAEFWRAVSPYLGHVSLTGIPELLFCLLLYMSVGAAGIEILHQLAKRFWFSAKTLSWLTQRPQSGAIHWLPVSVIILIVASVLYIQSTAPKTRSYDLDRENNVSARSCVVVILDTLRSDYLGCMGNSDINTPVLDGYSKQCQLYPTCIAPSSWTIPSHASLLSGKHSSAIWGIGLDQRERGFDWEQLSVPSNLTFITEDLVKKGYQTALISANPLVSDTFGFQQGFDHVTRFRIFPHRKLSVYRFIAKRLDFPRTVMEVRKASDVTKKGIEWLAAQDDDPYFLLLNYMDAHAPLLLDRMERRRLRSLGAEYMPESMQFRVAARVNKKKVPLIPEEKRFFTTAYGLVCERLDRQMGEIFRCIQEQDVEGKTAMVITSDHGESLGEKLFMGHGPSLQEEVIRVPLLTKWPQAGKGSIESNPVSLLNLHTSMCEYLNVPEGIVSERSLDSSNWPIRSEFLFWGGFAAAGGKRDWSPGVCMYEDDIKVILNPGQQTQAYDLASDPAEAYPLEVIETTQVVRVMAELETAVENDARLAGDQPEPGMDGIRKEQLKELGYIW